MTSLSHSAFFCPACEQEKDTSEIYRTPGAQPRFSLCNSCAKIGKICPDCETYKLFAEFAKDLFRNNGASAYCKPCLCIRSKLRHDPVKHRAHKLKIRFNLTQFEYDEMLQSQGGVCAICKQLETRLDNTSKRVRALSVDHDHETGAIRQLLCGSCNYLLGYVKDNADLLQVASEYLKMHKQ